MCSSLLTQYSLVEQRTCTMQMSVLEPASHGADVVNEVVPSAFVAVTFSTKVCEPKRKKRNREVYNSSQRNNLAVAGSLMKRKYRYAPKTQVLNTTTLTLCVPFIDWSEHMPISAQDQPTSTSHGVAHVIATILRLGASAEGAGSITSPLQTYSTCSHGQDTRTHARKHRQVPDVSTHVRAQWGYCRTPIVKNPCHTRGRYHAIAART